MVLMMLAEVEAAEVASRRGFVFVGMCEVSEVMHIGDVKMLWLV